LDIMHARELIELAALVTAHGPVLVRTSGRISESSIRQYWTASKSRLDRWGWTLRSLSSEAGEPGRPSQPSAWTLPRGTLEEIITGEVLARVWTAVLSAHDRFRGTDQAEPIAQSVLLGHLEARHRVLTLLTGGPPIDLEQAFRLNRLRRRAERWTDLLIGYLLGMEDVSRFAVEPDRAREFADDLRDRSRMKGGRYAWPLLLTSLRAAFQTGLAPQSPNGDLNAQIAASVLASLQPELFDATGLLRSAWLMRMTNVTDDTQSMLDELLAIEEPAWPSLIRAGTADRLRRFGD
jgi:hypothetical protein